MDRPDHRILVSAPDLGGNEEAYVSDALRSTWISSMGEYVDRFERDFATACNVRVTVSVVNGTAALHLALLALGVAPGDEVLVPSLTYVATANAVRYVGAEPVFVDVDPETWCLDPALVEDAITPKTRGMIPVHLYGHPADMDAINDIAATHGLWVVEDAAEAFGATYKGRLVGGLAAIGTFSFYGNKIITSGEGGALTVNDAELERLIRLYRGQGMDPGRRYFFPVVGYNYRLTNVACAILCAQLERAKEMREARRRVFERYRTGLADLEGIGFQPVASWAVPANWLFCITVDESAFGLSRDQLMTKLGESGVETRPLFIPIHQLPPYQSGDVPQRRLPITEQLGAIGMSLPTSSALPDADVDWIVSSIREAQQT